MAIKVNHCISFCYITLNENVLNMWMWCTIHGCIETSTLGQLLRTDKWQRYNMERSIPHTGKIQVNLWEKDWKILIWDGDISWRSWIKYCWASLAKISRFFYTQYKLRSNKFYLCFWWWLTWFIFHSPSHLFSRRSSAARFLLLPLPASLLFMVWG